LSFFDLLGLTALEFIVETGILKVDLEIEGVKPYTIDATSGTDEYMCVFRPSGPPIPAEAGHRFRTMPGRCDAVVGLSEMTTLSSTLFRFR
jgi:hypothetical protein